MYKDHVNLKKKIDLVKNITTLEKQKIRSAFNFFANCFTTICAIAVLTRWPNTEIANGQQSFYRFVQVYLDAHILLFITCSSSRLFLGHCPCNNINFYSFYRSRQQLHPPPFKIIHKGLILKIFGI